MILVIYGLPAVWFLYLSNLPMLEPKYISAEAAVQLVQSGNRVFIHDRAATPVSLVNALLQRTGTIRGWSRSPVTEYGAVNLYGKNLEQRARLLTNIVHPDHRESQERT